MPIPNLNPSETWLFFDDKIYPVIDRINELQQGVLRKLMKDYFRNKGSEIDMSSLMDIVFILLIFVMLSISFQKKIVTIDLDLPKSENQDAGNSKPKKEIIVLKTGEILYTGRKTDLQNLEAELKKNPKTEEYILLTEKQAEFEKFLKVLETLKKSGSDKIDLGLKK